MSRSEALTPQIQELVLAATDVEEGIFLPPGCKAFQITADAECRFAFTEGNAENSTDPYFTLKADTPWRSPLKMGWSGDLSLAGAASPAPPPAETPATTQQLWYVDPSTVSKTQYDAYVIATNPKFDSQANGRLHANVSDADFGMPRPVNLPINYETPTCETDGKITTFVKDDAENYHCLMRVTDTALFQKRWYMPPRIRRRWRSTINISATSDWANLGKDTGHDWALLWELIPGAFPAGHSKTPPIGFSIRGRQDVFEVTLRGNTGDPTTQSYDVVNTTQWAFATGIHTFEIEWIMDPTGTSNLFTFKMDTGTDAPTTTRVSSTQAIGLKYSGYSSLDAWTVIQFGTYTTSTGTPANFPSVTWHDSTLWNVL